jgi:hypothetical protein
MNHTPRMPPGDPPEGLEVRVARLESQMQEVLSILRRLEIKLEAMSRDDVLMRTELADLKGRVSQLPTVTVLVVALISTFAAGAGMLAAAARILQP